MALSSRGRHQINRVDNLWQCFLGEFLEREKKAGAKRTLLRHGAEGRTRTGTLSPAVDFESTTSANSITSAQSNISNSNIFYGLSQYIFLFGSAVKGASNARASFVKKSKKRKS